MSGQRNWWVGLRCPACRRAVVVSDRSEAASFHYPFAGQPWAIHTACREAAVGPCERAGSPV